MQKHRSSAAINTIFRQPGTMNMNDSRWVIRTIVGATCVPAFTHWTRHVELLAQQGLARTVSGGKFPVPFVKIVSCQPVKRQ